MTVPPMDLPISSLLQKRGGPVSNPPLGARRSSALPGELRVLDASTLGLVLDVYLLAPYVLLDRLGVRDHVLADPDFFLDDRALADDDLFLGHRYHDLVLADLGLRSLALHGHPLHTYTESG